MILELSASPWRISCNKVGGSGGSWNGGTPIAGWFISEKPSKMDDLGVGVPYFRNQVVFWKKLIFKWLLEVLELPFGFTQECDAPFHHPNPSYDSPLGAGLQWCGCYPPLQDKRSAPKLMVGKTEGPLWCHLCVFCPSRKVQYFCYVQSEWLVATKIKSNTGQWPHMIRGILYIFCIFGLFRCYFHSLL